MSTISKAVGALFAPRFILYTNTVGCGTLMGAGDVIVQGVEMAQGKHPDKKIQWARTARMFTMGIVLGPCNHGWYTFLDRILPGIRPTTIVRKILLDQIVASPFFAFTFFMGMGTLEGQSPKNSWREFSQKFWAVYKADWTVWPAAQAVNFYAVPTQFRVMYVGMVTLCWNTFLSYMKHQGQGVVIKEIPAES